MLSQHSAQSREIHMLTGLSPSLIEISFYGEQYTADDAQKIIDAVNTQITQPHDRVILNLSENQLSDDGLKALAPVISHPQVVEIMLDNNNLSTEGVQFLCELLSQRTIGLNALSLSNNNIGTGALNIAQLLQNQYPLKALDLSSCQMQPHDIKALAKALNHNTHLCVLNLNSNTINESIEEIAYMLTMNCSLQDLALNSTELSPQKSLLLGVALHSNQHLQALNIGCNDFDDDFCRQFAENLSTNNTLRKYQGPDSDTKIIKFICNRNKKIPCNAPWSLHFNINASHEEKCQQVILNAQTTNPPLLFLATKRALQLKLLSPIASVQSEDVFNSAYEFACENPLQSFKAAR